MKDSNLQTRALHARKKYCCHGLSQDRVYNAAIPIRLIPRGKREAYSPVALLSGRHYTIQFIVNRKRQ